MDSLEEFKAKIKQSVSEIKYGNLTLKQLNEEWNKLNKKLESHSVEYVEKYKPLIKKFGIFRNEKLICPICKNILNKTKNWQIFYQVTSYNYIAYCSCGYVYPYKHKLYDEY